MYKHSLFCSWLFFTENYSSGGGCRDQRVTDNVGFLILLQKTTDIFFMWAGLTVICYGCVSSLINSPFNTFCNHRDYTIIRSSMHVLLSDNSGITGPDKRSPPTSWSRLSHPLHTLPEAFEGFAPNHILKASDKSQTSQPGSVVLMARMRSFPSLEAYFTNPHLGETSFTIKTSNCSPHPAVIKKISTGGRQVL